MRPYTAMDPPQRIARLMEFNARLHRTSDSIRTLAEWQLDLDKTLVEIPGRTLAPQKLYFANGDEGR